MTFLNLLSLSSVNMVINFIDNYMEGYSDAVAGSFSYDMKMYLNCNGTCSPVGSMTIVSCICKYIMFMYFNYLFRLKPDVFEVIEQNCDGNWLQQATSYYTLRKTLHTEIANMSPKFFW